MRDFVLERALCKAIKGHLVVRLKYKTDLLWRTFEPYAVYKSTKDKILVAGTQTKNENDLSQSPEPRNFDTELISRLEITETVFKADLRFDRFDKKFANGFICVINPVQIPQQTF